MLSQLCGIIARLQSPGCGGRTVDQPAVGTAGKEMAGGVTKYGHDHLHHHLGTHGQLPAEIQYVLLSDHHVALVVVCLL